MTDGELLTKYADRACEESFCRLVERYLPLVEGVALRRTGRTEWVEDIAMQVFARAARKARALSRRASLGGWFVLAARMQAAQTLRHEHSRLRLMEKATRQPNTLHSDAPASTGSAALPWLDDALARLTEKERDTVLQHFYSGLSFREIAAREGRSEDAPRKRTATALQKMSLFFQQRGLTLSIAAVTAALTTEWSRAQPVVAARVVAQKALAHAPSLSAAGFGLVSLKIAKPLAAAAVLAVCAWPLSAQDPEISAAESSIAALEKLRRAEFSPPPVTVAARSEPSLPTAPAVREEIDLPALANHSLAAREGDADARGRVRRALEPVDVAGLTGLLESAAARGFPKDLAEAVTDSLLRALLAKDPEQAAKFSARFARAERLRESLERWARVSPQAALEWFTSQKESGAFEHQDRFVYPNMEHEATRGIAVALFASDHAVATKWIESLTPDEAARAVGAISEAPERTSADNSEIAALASRLSSSKKLAVLIGPVRRTASENPDEAASFIRSVTSSPVEQTSLLVHAAREIGVEGVSLTSRLSWLAEQAGPERAPGAQGKLLGNSLQDAFFDGDDTTAGKIEDIFAMMREMRTARGGDDLLAQFLEHTPATILYERTREWLELAATLPPGKAREQQLKWAREAAAKAAQSAPAATDKR